MNRHERRAERAVMRRAVSHVLTQRIESLPEDLRASLVAARIPKHRWVEFARAYELKKGQRLPDGPTAKLHRAFAKQLAEEHGTTEWLGADLLAFLDEDEKTPTPGSKG